jgi:hypothetical protein
MIMPFNPIVGKNGDIEIFYQGWDGPHDFVDGVSPPKRVSAVGLATLDAGRFVAMTASGTGEGVLIADGFIGKGGALFVNAELVNPDDLRVGIVGFKNGQREVYKNFKDIDSILTPYNNLYYKVTWTGRQDLSDLLNKTTILEFYLNDDAKLYGYTTNLAVVPEPASALLSLAGAAAHLTVRRRVHAVNV